VLIDTGAALYPVTISMTVTFLSPARPGPIFGAAVIRQLGKTIGFLEACLEDADGVEIARATSSVRLVPMRLEPLELHPAEGESLRRRSA
jgi:acyl-coenzyme A thioesterase PaaI-like protein